MMVVCTVLDGELSDSPRARTTWLTEERYEELMNQKQRKALEQMIREREEEMLAEEIRPRGWIKYEGFFYWLPYVAVAVGVVAFFWFALWVKEMEDQDCKDKGGDHRVRSGRYVHLCVTKDGRIVE